MGANAQSRGDIITHHGCPPSGAEVLVGGGNSFAALISTQSQFSASVGMKLSSGEDAGTVRYTKTRESQTTNQLINS